MRCVFSFFRCSTEPKRPRAVVNRAAKSATGATARSAPPRRCAASRPAPRDSSAATGVSTTGDGEEAFEDSSTGQIEGVARDSTSSLSRTARTVADRGSPVGKAITNLTTPDLGEKAIALPGLSSMTLRRPVIRTYSASPASPCGTGSRPGTWTQRTSFSTAARSGSSPAGSHPADHLFNRPERRRRHPDANPNSYRLPIRLPFSPPSAGRRLAHGGPDDKENALSERVPGPDRRAQLASPKSTNQASFEKRRTARAPLNLAAGRFRNAARAYQDDVGNLKLVLLGNRMAARCSSIGSARRASRSIS